MTTIYFTKLFTKGILKGLQVITSVTFDSSETDKWVKFLQSHREKPVTAFGDSYIVTDMSFQNYKR